MAAKEYLDLPRQVIANALNYVSPDDRETWTRMGMAIKSELGDDGQDIWLEWSRNSGSFDERAANHSWKSFSAGKGVTIATLIYHALEGGFKFDNDNAARLDDTQARARQLQREEAARRSAIEEKARHKAAATMAAELWDTAEPATDHPYLTKKGIQPHGARIGRWPLRNRQGEIYKHADGVLLVPIYGPGNKIQSLQGVYSELPKGYTKEKSYLFDGKKSGGYYIIGKRQIGRPVYLCEGFATGATIHEATGCMVLVAFDSGNLFQIAQMARKEMAGEQIIIAADNDVWTKDNPGVRDARKAAAGINAKVIVPSFRDDSTKPTDFNDLAALEGLDTVRQQLAQPVALPANDNMPDDPDEAMAAMNANHALVLVGDKAAVFRESISDRGAPEVKVIGVPAFRLMMANQFCTIQTAGKDGAPVEKRVPVADLWMKSYQRRTYEGVTFAPAGNAPANYYNLWHGFKVDPLEISTFQAGMGCRRLLHHLLYNVCNGHKDQYRYLLGWMADLIQDPDEKKGVALVLRGLKGTGKSKLADILSRLMGAHAIKIAQMKHLLGAFNRHLADKLLIVVEESFWAGGKADEGPLKDMITSDRMLMESKGVDAVEVRSLCRIIMITNNDWAVPASVDERRYFVLNVEDYHKGDFAYFAAMDRQLYDNDDYGLRCLLTFLQRYDLSNFNMRQIPETAELRQQRALSLDPHEQYIHDAIVLQDISGAAWTDDRTVLKHVLYEHYLESSRKRGKLHLLADSIFAKYLIKLGFTSTKVMTNDGRRPAWRMPTCEEAAANFERLHKIDMRLEEPPEAENSPY